MPWTNSKTKYLKDLLEINNNQWCKNVENQEIIDLVIFLFLEKPKKLQKKQNHKVQRSMERKGEYFCFAFQKLSTKYTPYIINYFPQKIVV